VVRAPPDGYHAPFDNLDKLDQHRVL
jgi:hypothetical protein